MPLIVLVDQDGELWLWKDVGDGDIIPEVRVPVYCTAVELEARDGCVVLIETRADLLGEKHIRESKGTMRRFRCRDLAARLLKVTGQSELSVTRIVASWFRRRPINPALLQFAFGPFLISVIPLV